MPDPTTNTNPATEPDDNGGKNFNEMLVEAMKNMVPKADFDNLNKEHEDLIKKVLNGEFSGDGTQKGPTPPTQSEKDERFKQLMNGFHENKFHTPTEHISAMLEIDDYLVEKGNRSLFEASTGDRNYNGAYEESMKVKEILKDALEESHGNDMLLMAKIQDALIDNPTSRKR